MNKKNYFVYTLCSSDEPERVRYVGITSTNVKDRFHKHKNAAKDKKRRSQPVHKWMYSKYELGLDIIYQLIDECEECQWQEKEKYWIDYYRNLKTELLNLQSGGSGVVTKAMRNIDGIQRSIEAHKHPIAAYDVDGNEIMRFDSIVSATKHCNLKSKSTISNCIQGRLKTAAGYYWKKLEKVNIPTPSKTTNPNYNTRHIINKFDLDGNLIYTYQSARQMMREEGKSGSGDHFVKNFLNKGKIWLEHFWSTEESINIKDYDKLNYVCYEVDENGIIIKKFKSIKHAARTYGVVSSTVISRINSGKEIANKKFIKRY